MSNHRRADQLRPTTIQPYPTAAAGGVVIRQGNTQVLCTASIAEELPPWMTRAANGGSPPRGWVTAEYAMLPGSTPQRKRRGTDSRATEIQRLIGRSLRASVDLGMMPGVMITCDCDVIVADGGTRTASITGGFVALAMAVRQARQRGLIQKDPFRGRARGLRGVAAVSVGIVDGQPSLDLDYERDVRAQVDMNVVMDHRGEFVEVQGTGESGTFSRGQLDQLLDMAASAIRKLIRIQRQSLKETH